MKRGQAALDFLSTYGFSFLIILSAFGGLAYMGVFNISNFVPDSCDLGSELFCPLFALELDEDNFAVNIQLVNAGNDRLIIQDMSIKDGAQEEYCFANRITDTSSVTLSTDPELTLVSRADGDFVFEFEEGPNCVFADSFIQSSQKRKYDVRVYYRESGATQKTSVSGTITIEPTVYS